jgi:hypothetical protein
MNSREVSLFVLAITFPRLVDPFDRQCAQAYGLGSQCRPNECIFGSGKPRGVRISGRGPHGVGEGNGESVYEQPGNEVDGSCHSKEGSK